MALVDPQRLDDTVEAIHEAPFPGLAGLRRLVRRNDDTVRAVLVNGRTAWRGGDGSPDLGTSTGYGTLLPLGGGG